MKKERDYVVKRHECTVYPDHTRLPFLDIDHGWVIVLFTDNGQERIMQIHFCPFCGEDLKGIN